MTFTWHFYTGEPVIHPVVRRCHRGPMTELEVVMSVPFTHMTSFNTLRQRLLDDIVDTTLPAVQTREVVLRSLNSLLGPMMARLLPDKRELQVLICEKRNSVDIDSDLASLSPFYLSAIRSLYGLGLPTQQIDLLEEALKSHSPIMRVAGMCSVILIATFVEFDYHNG